MSKKDYINLQNFEKQRENLKKKKDTFRNQFNEMSEELKALQKIVSEIYEDPLNNSNAKIITVEKEWLENIFNEMDDYVVKLTSTLNQMTTIEDEIKIINEKIVRILVK